MSSARRERRGAPAVGEQADLELMWSADGLRVEFQFHSPLQSTRHGTRCPQNALKMPVRRTVLEDVVAFGLEQLGLAVAAQPPEHVRGLAGLAGKGEIAARPAPKVSEAAAAAAAGMASRFRFVPVRGCASGAVQCAVQRGLTAGIPAGR